MTEMFREMAAWGRPRAAQGDPEQVQSSRDGSPEPGKPGTQLSPWLGEAGFR